jgi:hypothetical protein
LDGVAECDVAGYAFVEAVFAEDAEGGGQAAFEVLAFFVLVGEGWWTVKRGVNLVDWCGGSCLRGAWPEVGVEHLGVWLWKGREALRWESDHLTLGYVLLDARLESCLSCVHRDFLAV